MAVRGIDSQEEKKSYGAAFLLGTSLLVGLGLWSWWDDNITRRPWKKIQAEFHQLDYQKALASYQEEGEKLKADPNYRELVRKLQEARTSLEEGEMARKLRELRSREEDADVRFQELDQEVKFIKSELEEVWYEYDHAVQQGRGTRVYEERIRALEKGMDALVPDLEEARRNRQQIKEEIKEIYAGIRELEDELAKLTAEREKWTRTMEEATVSLGPVSFYQIPRIKQVVLPEFDRNHFDLPVDRVDRCQSCHMGINRPGFEDAPQPFRTHPRREVLLGDHAHPPETFGCTVCHQGQGPAVNSVAQAHGEVAYWEFPLLRGEKVQSSCASCHLDVQTLEDAPLLAQGRRLFEQVGCTGCHLVQGYEDIPKIGPSLKRLAAKADPNWVVHWIENPQDFRPRTRMPNFSLTREEALAITAFLWSLSKEEGEAWLGNHPLPGGLRGQNGALVARGKELVETVGCKGCHGIAEGEFSTVLGQEKDVVPNLSGIGAKVGPRWAYHWIKNPDGYSPDTRMPSLRLSDREALAITSYLMTLGRPIEKIEGLGEKLEDPENIRRGESLVRKYGCFGCHEIKGMENESRIGVELTTFGSKKLEELFFGNRPEIPRTWDDWTYNKLKEPRIYATPRVEQVMPQFYLKDEDIRALRTLLAGFVDSEVSHQFRADQSKRVVDVVQGRRLMHQYNCIGCHEIENRGGFVRKYYENPALAPPPLNGEGEKVQSSWLYKFLKAPIPLRPWLQIRMPTFGFTDEEANLLVGYFNGLSKVQIPYVHFDRKQVPQGHLDAARKLVSKEYFDCLSCHQQGERKPEGPPEGWAPDLALAGERLNPGWIIKWLRDPQKVQPGTKMPSFYPGGPDDILGGSDDRQIEAMRDYLMLLGSEAPAAGGQKVASR